MNVEILVSQSQPDPLVTPQQETISASEGMVDFVEDDVVSLGKYFWRKKDKSVMKNGTKRMREGTIKKVPALTQVIWKSYSPDTQQGDLYTTGTMGDFAGDNYDSVS